MPQRLLSATIWIACTRCAKQQREAAQKKWLRKIRSQVLGGSLGVVERDSSGVARQKSGIRKLSETEVRQIAVAVRNLRAGHQSAVDGGEEAAEQARGGRKGDCGGLGHLGSRVAGRRWPSRRFEREVMYTRCQNNGFVCIAAIWPVQCSIGRCPNPINDKAARWRPFNSLIMGDFTPQPPCAAGRARRNRGFRRSGDR